jgi:hypothetical protein
VAGKSAEVNARSVAGDMPLRLASFNQNWKMVDLLRRHGGKESSPWGYRVKDVLALLTKHGRK